MNFPRRRNINNNGVGVGGGNGRFGFGFLRVYHLGFFVALMFAIMSMWMTHILDPDAEQIRTIHLANQHNNYQAKDAYVEPPPEVQVPIPSTTTNDIVPPADDWEFEAGAGTPTADNDNDVEEEEEEEQQQEGEDEAGEEEEQQLEGEDEAGDKTETKTTTNRRPNLLFIVCDQLRWDTIGVVQRILPAYRDKLKIRTPNIDRLQESGVWFKNAYCGSPSCAPSRAMFRTGNSLQRATIKGNRMLKDSVWKLMKSVREKVLDLETFEQVLYDKMGYSIKTFGKWHVPYRFYNSKQNPRQRIIEHNYLDFRENILKFAPAQSFKPLYQPQLFNLLEQDNLQFTYQDGQQKNPVTKQPYTPALLDPRKGRETNNPLKGPKFLLGNSNILGRDVLPAKYTTTALLAKMSLRALDEMIANVDEKPFCLSVHFNAPHPPIVATSAYLDYYYSQRGNIFVPPSIKDDLQNTPYQKTNMRLKLLKAGVKYNSEPNVRDLTSYYYAMIEEVDAWLGIFLNKLKDAAIDDNTLIIFTSDHGEMLGSHGLKGKGLLLEEATKVPLFMSFPGKIKANSKVGSPVSHIDLFATIMDYLEVPSQHDKSDGRTLRRFMSNNINKFYEERYAVVELDAGRRPLGPNQLSGKLGQAPNFSIRKGRWKLIITKNRDADHVDMLFDLRADPYEMRNKIGNKGMSAQGYIIGKAEYLKCLLVEWMHRNDGPRKLYTSPSWNLGEGQGDIAEIRARRTWRRVKYWQSDGTLSFGQPILRPDGLYKRNEYIYVGRTMSGQLLIPSISVEGPHKNFFTVSPGKATIKQGSHLRIRVHYEGKRKSVRGLNAKVVIKNNVNGAREIQIVGER